MLGKLFHKVKKMHKFALALAAAIILAITMTVISVIMYMASGVSSIDLSRPGYEQARKDLKDSNTTPSFDPTGPLNSAVVEQFIQTYNSQATETRTFGGFNDTAIDDNNLGLTPADATQPSASP